MWENIKCKECGSQDKALFMMPKPVDGEDCYCEEHQKAELEKRAKA